MCKVDAVIEVAVCTGLSRNVGKAWMELWASRGWCAE